MNLDAHRRADLIAEVDSMVTRVRQQAHSTEEARKVLDMTSFALHYLRRRTPDALRVLLETPHATTIVQRYWQNFGVHLKPTLSRLEAACTEPVVYHEALLYLFGWLHRVRLGPIEDGNRVSEDVRDKATQVSRPDHRQKSREYRPLNRPSLEEQFSVKLGTLLNQPATPSPAPAPTYRRGDRVQVTAITSGVNGVVRLPDGVEIRNINLYGVKAGATITVRISDVTSIGRIKRVVR